MEKINTNTPSGSPNYVVTWENDWQIDPIVEKYCMERYRNYDLYALTALSQRDPLDIIHSLGESRQNNLDGSYNKESEYCKAVVIRPYQIERDQVRSLVKLLHKGIYGYIYGSGLNEIRFICNFPKIDAQTIIDACNSKEWNDEYRIGLFAICYRVSVYFENPITHELYQIKCEQWSHRDFEIVQLNSGK